MTIELLINILVTVSLIELMAAIGLAVTLDDLGKVLTSPRLVLQAALANYVCVPAVAVALLLLLGVEPMIAAGILIAVVCPGAPYGPPLTAIAKGNLAVSVGLMVVLAGSSAIVAPILLSWLLPAVSTENSLRVNALQMIGTLLVIQLLPLCVGLALRQWCPHLADRLLKPANQLSVVLNLSVIGVLLVVHYETLRAIRPTGLAGMLTLVFAALGAGWLLGVPGRGIRTATAITTAVRNAGVGLVIAINSSPGTAVVSATVAFAVVQTVAVAVLALSWGRMVRAAPIHPAGHAT